MKSISFNAHKLGVPFLAFIAVTWLAALTVLVLQITKMYEVFNTRYTFVYGVFFVVLTQVYVRLVRKK
ncbi:hypothetical protein [Neptunitalea lumnitzerae]|uniref:hypothetical protein n=1 Tax=Neptunitalea lumnitzerae TaxID=2965509 RepID=UPI0024921B78|nr:hypothetical protein [Neptunitalea sp. Y10]